MNSELLFFNLKKQLILLDNSVNESIISNIYEKVKLIIKNLLGDHDDWNDKFPRLIQYIEDNVSNILIRKKLIGYAASFLITMGISLTDVKNVFAENGVSKEVNWSEFKQKSVIPDTPVYYFETGEYIIPSDVLNKAYNKLQKFIDSDTKTISGNLVVSISIDENKDKENYANDDTPQEKKKGGNLLSKRKTQAITFLNGLKMLFKKDGVELNITIEAKEASDKYLKFEDLVKFDSSTKYSGDIYNKGEDEEIYSDKATIAPTPEGGVKDISGLSRTYQIVELLKLGEINAKRISNNDYRSGDKYSMWILNFRKSIKKFLTRLQRSFPEYDIYFNRDAIAFNSIEGAVKGMSNISKQYTRLKGESRLYKFNEFINENYCEVNSLLEYYYAGSEGIYDKWSYILGKTFPDLTEEQAIEFDSNIEIFLNYLEQMYGHSALEFTYKK